MKIYKLLLIFIILLSSLYGDDLKKVSLQLLWKHQFEFAGFYMAKEKGFYKDAGVDVDLKEYKLGTNITKDVLDGKSTFGIGYPSIILDKSNGADIVLLNAIFQSSPNVLVTLKSSGITSIKDFKNKKIMIEKDAIKTAPLLSMLYSKGISLDDLKIVKPTFHIEDLINKKVDISSAYLSNEIYQLDDKAIPYKIWNPSDYGFDFYNDILFTSNKFLTNYPKLVVKFQKASLLGWKYAFNHIDETIKVILKKYNTQHKTKEALQYEAKILKKLAYKNRQKIGTIKKEKIQRIIDIYNLMGLIKHKIDLDKFISKNNNKNIINLTKKEKEYLKNKKVIKMCIDPDWMPFEKIQDGKHIGMTADFFKIFEYNLGYKIKLIPTKNWSQSLEFAKNRRCDILSLAMETPKRKKYMNFTSAYLKVPLVLATKNDKPFINDFTSLGNKKVGIPKGYAFVELLKTKYPNLNIIEVKNIDDGLEKVITGELYGYIGTLASVGYAFQNRFTGELKIAGKFDEKWKLGIAVRNDDLVLLGIFEKLIKSVNSVQSQKILNNWLTIKYEKQVNYKLLWQILLFISIVILFFIYRQYILKKSNQKLAQAVEEKTKDLNEINKYLETRIEKAVEENSKKDKILASQAKMAAMGEMIGNISHQWRQPLSVITTAASGMQLKIEYDMFDKDEAIKDLEALIESAQYLSTTIDDFKNFLKPSKVKELFTIQSVIDKNMKMFGKSFSNNNIDFILNLDDSKVNGNQNELLQVIINILNNAKDIFKELDIEHKYIFIDSISENDTTIVTIKDNAGGIPDDVLPKIFDAYFTTKHQSKGTGLGLYMSYQIIANSFNGILSAENEVYTYNNIEYKGAKFMIKLPQNREN